MTGKALNKASEVVDVKFDVDIKATAPVEWTEDEQPTGWNHKLDSPTFTSTTFAEVTDINIENLQFSDGMAFYINGESYYLQDAQQIIDPSVMKQLLDPTVYVKLLQPHFDNKVENMEPAEADYYEPEDERY